MKHVLVTGADGFIGSHLVEMLLEKGVRVRALALYNSFGNWGWLEEMNPGIKSRALQSKQLEVVLGDIRDHQCCQNIVRDIDTVFHLAALIAIPYSYQCPQSFFDTNVNGTVNLCRAALEAKVQLFVQTSTSEVYGTAQLVPIPESHILQPQSPYSASKIASDCAAVSFQKSFGLPVVVARPFNTYGPRQSARAVIPTIISQIASGKTEVDLGDLTPTRDLNFVEDTCRGFLAIEEKGTSHLGEAFNLGSGREISIGGLFELIAQLMNSPAKIRVDQQRLRPKNSEVLRLLCDTSKSKRELSFSSQVGLEQGLSRTIAWFQNPQNLARYKAGIYNV